MHGLRHDPVRTCVVCGSRKCKTDLFRLARASDSGLIILDPRRRLPGRGAYVCPECLPRLRFHKRVQKAFRNEAKGLSEDILLQLPTR
jgi:predicted RNA-binding protein YlxR (DUF448 family)